MGACTSKPNLRPNPYSPKDELQNNTQHPKSLVPETQVAGTPIESNAGKKSPFFPFYTPSPAHSLFSKKSPAPASANSTPRRFFRPPSPARHIKAVLARRQGAGKKAIQEEKQGEEGGEGEDGVGLDKRFGFSKEFRNKYEVGEEVGRGHFGYTCLATAKKGELKGQQVAVKVIPKAKVELNPSLSILSVWVFSLERLIEVS